jgi:hypothetical protein
MLNLDVQGQLSWALTKKLNFALEGGEESEEILSKPRSRTSTLIYSGSASYQATSTTSVGLSANRSIEPSPLGGDLSRTTSASLSVTQRVLTHFTVTAGVNQGDTSYLATSLGLPVVRHDAVTGAQFGIGTQILRHVSLAGSFGETRDSSDASAFSFVNRHFGFSVGISY